MINKPLHILFDQVKGSESSKYLLYIFEVVVSSFWICADDNLDFMVLRPAELYRTACYGVDGSRGNITRRHHPNARHSSCVTFGFVFN